MKQQEEMAAMLNVGQGTLSKYMNDRIPAPFDLVISIPQRIKSEKAKSLVLEWRKKFDQMFWQALIQAIGREANRYDAKRPC